MTISKQQWAGIEASIRSGRTVTFDYQGQQVSVHKVQTDETHLAYIVAVDSKPLMGWFKEDHAQYEPLAAIFLRKRLVNTTARIARGIAKERSGKAWLKQKENRHYLEKDVEVTDTFFPTAKTVVNHFRKIEGLALKSPLNPAMEGDHVPVRDGL